LVAGIACAEAIREAADLDVRLKWPNDIVWKAAKLGGILCEGVFLGSSLSYAVLGIGLNIDQRSSDFPAGLRRRATSLRLTPKGAPDRETLESCLWRSLDRWYGAFRRGNKLKIVRAFGSWLIFPIGTVISVRTGREDVTLRGVFLGVDSRARLMIERHGKRTVFSPAEIIDIDYNSEVS
jgi:BirA family biotin operon repressor/biotin-[acetyl-CoA-carboxylase] ligase